MFEMRKHFVLFVVDDPAACRASTSTTSVRSRGRHRLVRRPVVGVGAPDGPRLPQAEHPTQPLRHRQRTAGCRFITFEVDAVDPIAAAGRSGLAVDVPLRDEPWGQRHLIVLDPAGNGVDVVQNIGPDREFARQWFRWSRERPRCRSGSSPGSPTSASRRCATTTTSVSSCPRRSTRESRYRRYNAAQTGDAQLIRRLRPGHAHRRDPQRHHCRRWAARTRPSPRISPTWRMSWRAPRKWWRRCARCSPTRASTSASSGGRLPDLTALVVRGDVSAPRRALVRRSVRRAAVGGVGDRGASHGARWWLVLGGVLRRRRRAGGAYIPVEVAPSLPVVSRSSTSAAATCSSPPRRAVRRSRPHVRRARCGGERIRHRHRRGDPRAVHRRPRRHRRSAALPYGGVLADHG